MSTAIHNPPMETLIDANEASKILNRPVRTIQYLVAKGEIPGMKIGKVWRFSPSILRRWIESHMEAK